MMKRFALLILAAVMLCGVAAADNQLFTKPLKDMTTEELQAAELEINNELLNRYGWIEGLTIEPGIYIAGEDFPAGSYYFEGVEGRYAANIRVYPSKDKTKPLDALQTINGIGSNAPKTGRMILEEGNALEIASGPAVIHVYKGLMP